MFRLGIGGAGRSWRAVLLTSGTGQVSTSQSVLPFAATSLIWMPWGADLTLRVAAGGVGVQFAVSNDVLSNAIGLGAESSELRLLAGRQVIVPLEPGSVAALDASNLFAIVLREAQQESGGSASMIEAQLRALLVILWRNSSFERDEKPALGRPLRTLQHFRQLLETHFRDRWTLEQYANEIGISPDRLHDICTKELGRTPRRLVQERLLHEARLMLQNTGLSVEQISVALGFRDVGHFSRFFKSKMQYPPATFRRKISLEAADASRVTASEFADWP